MPETRRILRRRPPDDSKPEPRRINRRYDEDDTEDEEPENKLTVVRGWGGYKHIKASAPSKWTKLYRIPDQGEGLIMFLEDEPYAAFMQHWCDWLVGKKQSYVCLLEDCPLCEIEPASPRARFNILDCDPSAPIPKLYTFECSITVADTLNKFNNDDRIGPIGDSYFAISYTGSDRKKGSRRTQLRPIKARDLVDDWKFNPLTDHQLDEFHRNLWTDDDIEKTPKEELREIADAAVK